MSASPAPAESATGADQHAFNARDFRDALGAFATGVTVITTQGTEQAYGMTANAFSSVSLDPPLILVCVIKGTEGSASIEKNGVFAVNILAADQEPISRYFSSRDRPRGAAAFRQISHSRAASGSPILDDCAAYLDCRLHAAHEAGDHVVYIGEVMAMGVNLDVHPLLFHRGKYRYFGE